MGLRDFFKGLEQNLLGVGGKRDKQPIDINEAASLLEKAIKKARSKGGEITPKTQESYDFANLYNNFANHPFDRNASKKTKEQASALFAYGVSQATPETVQQIANATLTSELAHDCAESKTQRHTYTGFRYSDYQLMYDTCEGILWESIELPMQERIALLSSVDRNFLARMVELHENNRATPLIMVLNALEGKGTGAAKSKLSQEQIRIPTAQALEYLRTSPTWQRLCKREPDRVKDMVEHITSNRLASAIIDPTDIPEFFDTSRPKTISLPKSSLTQRVPPVTPPKDTSIKGVIKQYWDLAAIPATDQLHNAFREVVHHPKAAKHISGLYPEDRLNEMGKLLCDAGKKIPPEEILSLVQNTLQSSAAYKILATHPETHHMNLDFLTNLLKRAPEADKYDALCILEARGQLHDATEWEKSDRTVRLLREGLASSPDAQALAYLRGSQVWNGLNHKNPRLQEWVDDIDQRFLQALNL